MAALPLASMRRFKSVRPRGGRDASGEGVAAMHSASHSCDGETCILCAPQHGFLSSSAKQSSVLTAQAETAQSSGYKYNVKRK